MLRKHSLKLLDFSDPIFSSLREDYTSFDSWAARIQHEPVKERYAFSVDSVEGLKAVAIVKQHEAPSLSKLSTFKVSEAAAGEGLGSALLEAVLEEVKNSGSSAVVVDFFPWQLQLQSFFESKGFTQVDGLPSGEMRYQLQF